MKTWSTCKQCGWFAEHEGEIYEHIKNTKHEYGDYTWNYNTLNWLQKWWFNQITNNWNNPISIIIRFIEQCWWCVKCQNCNHTLYHHVSYYKSPDREGVCVHGDCIDSECGCREFE